MPRYSSVNICSHFFHIFAENNGFVTLQLYPFCIYSGLGCHPGFSRRMKSGESEKCPWGWGRWTHGAEKNRKTVSPGGGSHIKVTGVLVGFFKSDP